MKIEFVENSLVLYHAGNAVLKFNSAPLLKDSCGQTINFNTNDSTVPFSLSACSEDGSVRYKRNISINKKLLSVSLMLEFLKGKEITFFCDSFENPWKNIVYKWLPNLCPEEGQVAGDHCFRSPAIILHDGNTLLSIMPDLDILGIEREKLMTLLRQEKSSLQRTGMFMELLRQDDGTHKMSIGYADYECTPHVYYNLTGRRILFPEKYRIKCAYDILVSEEKDIDGATSFLWDRYAARYKNRLIPQKLPFVRYAEPAFTNLPRTGEFIEFMIADGKTSCGIFRPNPSASDLCEYFSIPGKCVWFSAWFNNLRTAFGLKYYSSKNLLPESRTWNIRADMMKELILGAPDFLGKGPAPAIYHFTSGEWWCGVPRLGGGRDIFDLTASAETARWMLLWYRLLEKDGRLLERVSRTADFFCELQADDGSFPTFISKDGQISGLLSHSGQSGILSLLLCEMYRISKDKNLLDKIIKSCNFYISSIIPESKFHDFENFFSCSEKPVGFMDIRTDIQPQNSLCLQWIADTLLNAYEFTGEAKYLDYGTRCLNRLSLYQQVWNPPYISLYTFGGFGVMNTDGEWNDTRQVLFSDTYFKAYRLSGKKEYFERGVAALRAGCALICHPANYDINPLMFNGHPDGMAPENFAHPGNDGRALISSYDWGTGAIMTMAAISEINYGNVYVDFSHKQVFGIDCLEASAEFKHDIALLKIRNPAPFKRTVKILFNCNGEIYEKFYEHGANCMRAISFDCLFPQREFTEF